MSNAEVDTQSVARLESQLDADADLDTELDLDLDAEALAKKQTVWD